MTIAAAIFQRRKISLWSLALRACAAGLLLLTVSPLTAPFSTFDLSDLTDPPHQTDFAGEHAVYKGGLEAKISLHKSIADVSTGAVQVFGSPVAPVHPGTLTDPIGTFRLRHAVLRN